ncbi:aldo/keto reductase [Holzapfeliella sp. He02]|uniref:Aldo/keto reductase n=1 Tax=Holzapfeliella saturejae TaxID=3082953 RepID=A0ABU8SF09_9LACO
MIPNFSLYNNKPIPALGFGTYKLTQAGGIESIKSALNCGYRLIDTAYNYQNEREVGQAIQESGVAREDIQVISKLPGRFQRYDDAKQALATSLENLGLDYVDYYLIHWPNPKQGFYVEAFQALLDAKKEGLIKEVGVCNFLPEHLTRLKEETGEYPAINQIELHPYFSQPELREFHQKHEIVTQAWSPLLRTSLVDEEPVLRELAAKYDKSIYQIILRWIFQLGVIAIPKSSSRARQEQNQAIFDFELSSTEVDQICALDRPDGRQKNQDPAVYEEF